MDVPSEKPENMDSQSRYKSEPLSQENNNAAKPPPRRMSSQDTERPPSAQQPRRHLDEHTDASDDEDASDSDPAEMVDDFDWDDLHARYHKAMDECHDHEGALTEEWESLMNYFRIWAGSGHEHETDRTFQRLKTRTAYVQNAEAKFESKRNHYINVVKAFEGALQLLKAQSFSR
ncbi:hypothetical protein ACEQ8H_000672 [Pleosporales sp. CAS-2024a]